MYLTLYLDFAGLNQESPNATLQLHHYLVSAMLTLDYEFWMLISILLCKLTFYAWCCDWICFNFSSWCTFTDCFWTSWPHWQPRHFCFGKFLCYLLTIRLLLFAIFLAICFLRFLIQIGPPNSRLTSKEKKTWAAKEVADSVLSDKSALVTLLTWNTSQ